MKCSKGTSRSLLGGSWSVEKSVKRIVHIWQREGARLVSLPHLSFVNGSITLFINAPPSGGCWNHTFVHLYQLRVRVFSQLKSKFH